MNYRLPVLVLSIVLNLVLIWALVFSSRGISDYNLQNGKVTAMEDRIKQIGEENLGLSREIRLLQSDDKYIEQMIRKRLNYVRSNELWYMFDDADKNGVK